ncbi:MAG: hypothetical protein HFE47_06110 [Clostridia bacterium]|nr:hypothetical protein [Clostridia bacterium]
MNTLSEQLHPICGIIDHNKKYTPTIDEYSGICKTIAKMFEAGVRTFICCSMGSFVLSFRLFLRAARKHNKTNKYPYQILHRIWNEYTADYDAIAPYHPIIKKYYRPLTIIETMECIVEQESDILIVGMNQNYKGNSLAIQRAQRKNKKIIYIHETVSDD